MRINIVQTNYDPTDIGRLKEVLSDLEGLTCFPECFVLGRSGIETLQYLNKVSDEAKRIVEAVKKTGKTVILPLIEWHPVMRNRFYNTTYSVANTFMPNRLQKIIRMPIKTEYHDHS